METPQSPIKKLFCWITLIVSGVGALALFWITVFAIIDVIMMNAPMTAAFVIPLLGSLILFALALYSARKIDDMNGNST